ncbi:hypothetical protein J3R30DRAFT_3434551 [Lentinula aciculospora]|uniref:Uncharacterized protein n=1 Tax=Lentinula aciculospora TaxID=153920 RepID=A0A9W9AT84_9AGAR|nr:hypothetical protein J3R30DRAFT_3434551 [Lentinula aciculospora]
MAQLAGNVNSCVAFPSSSNNQDRTSVYSVQSSISTNSNDSQPPPALPYLPFRRISLPSLPPSQSIQHSPLRRQTTQPQRSSVASFESFPAIEERERRESTSIAKNHPVPKIRKSAVFSSPNVTPRKGQRRIAVSIQSGSKPPSMSPMRRRSQALAALPLDDPLLVRRRKVILEFYQTEKAYVEGLDLIYEHFLLPILNSLETSTPILERPLLTAVFSNFIDIWNFHRSFFNELTALFYGLEHRQANSPLQSDGPTSLEEPSPAFPSSPPPLSPILLAHFPYLSLYTPFITAFSQTLAALSTLLTPSHYYRQQPRAQTRAAVARVQSSTPSSLASPSKVAEFKYEKRFADFVATQEKHPRCRKLQLRDWLLTIVQRCPRYLLLLGDLLSCTPGEAQSPPEDGKQDSQGKSEEDKRRWYREATHEEERERENLIKVFGLVSKITNSLNTSIWSHSQTLALLALQRSTLNLPLDEFQFISPGRMLLKRGTLMQSENPDARVKRGESKDGDMRPREREFLLFSDCLVWLASEETEKKEKEWNFDLGSFWTSFSGGTGSGTSTPVKSADVERSRSATPTKPTPLIIKEEVNTSDELINYDSSDHKTRVAPASAIPRNLRRPPMVRTRSKSEAEITALHAKAAVASTSFDSLPSSDLPSPSQTASPTDKNARRPTHKSNFYRINKNSALHLHFRDRRGRKDSIYSPRSAGYGDKGQEQWFFKGRINLVNLEIVVDTSFGIEDELEKFDSDSFDEIKWRWEVLSPEGSFVLYAASARERTEWTTLIRQAKSQQLISLNAQHPNSTLTSSEATQHIRHALQALPFAPGDVRMQVVKVDKRQSRVIDKGFEKGQDRGNVIKMHKSLESKDKASKAEWYNERRFKVEHWVPPIWIPDEKAEGCMRCGRAFGWRRRRHHCRLCGRCVCSSCSEKTFYITDPNLKGEGASKPARACNACYESVFPLIDPPSVNSEGEVDESTVRARPQHPTLPHSSISDSISGTFLPSSTSGLTFASNADTITSLSHLPSWMTMSVPSLPLSSSRSSVTGVADARSKSKGKELSGPKVLMAIDSRRYSCGLDERGQSSTIEDSEYNRLSRDSGVAFDLDSSTDDVTLDDVVQPARSGSRIKLRSQSYSGLRPRSYYEIMEDFRSTGGEDTPQTQIRRQAASSLEEMNESDEEALVRLAYADGEDSSALSSSSMNSSRQHTVIDISASSSSVSLSISPLTSSARLDIKGRGSALVAERREDTVRRNKRFSMPAVALQTTSVVARIQSTSPETSSVVPRGKSVAFVESSPSGEDWKRISESRLGGLLPGMPGTRSKKFSLVLGGHRGQLTNSHTDGRNENGSPSSRRIGRNDGNRKHEGTYLGKGVAASKLNELLGKSKHMTGS